MLWLSYTLHQLGSRVGCRPGLGVVAKQKPNFNDIWRVNHSTALFWVITQRQVIILSQRFETHYFAAEAWNHEWV